MSGFNGKKNLGCGKKNGSWNRKNYDDRLINKIDRQRAEQVDSRTVKLQSLFDEARANAEE